MRIQLVSRIDSREALGFAGNLKEELERNGHTVTFDDETAGALHCSGSPLSRPNADLVVVIGGDGTILRTVQEMRHQVPLIGINHGEVGFLADLETEDALDVLTHLKIPFPVEQRLRVAFSRNGTHLGDALNEALIITTRPAKMLRFSVIIDGIPADQFRADGLLVSSPTGSTAYAMSAGGPIVDPRIEGILLVPLAPYMLSARPHLISNERKIVIRLESSKPAHIVIDGQQTIELGPDDSIEVTKSGEPALFLNAGRNFFSKVNDKLRRL